MDAARGRVSLPREPSPVPAAGADPAEMYASASSFSVVPPWREPREIETSPEPVRLEEPSPGSPSSGIQSVVERNPQDDEDIGVPELVGSEPSEAGSEPQQRAEQEEEPPEAWDPLLTMRSQPGAREHLCLG